MIRRVWGGWFTARVEEGDLGMYVLGRRGLILVLLVGGVALLPGLGAGSRLTYHEALVAQGAREMLATGDFLVPRVGGRIWLEKPPLSHWLVSAVGLAQGGVDGWAARLPSAVAALALAGLVASWCARHWGRRMGLAAGLCQATAAWWVTRGRLSDCDMLLAALIGGVLVAFDGARSARTEEDARRARAWFWSLLGATALSKGVGFGATLALAAILGTAAWDQSWRGLARLWSAPWSAVAALIALAWPLLVLRLHPEALGLWLGHVTGRVAEARFAGEPVWEYALGPWLSMFPWTPLVAAGAWRSWGRARRERGSPDRLLWSWFVVPTLLVGLSPARNSHYVLGALPPLAVWAAMGAGVFFERCVARGYRERGVASAALGMVFVTAGMWGLGFALLAPRIDPRGKGVEWAFYEDLSRRLEPASKVVLLYDAENRRDRWDRAPYQTPWGPVPPDLAARLFYLGRNDAQVVYGAGELRIPTSSAVVIARERDQGLIREMGEVAELARGPTVRADRSFVAYRITPGRAGVAVSLPARDHRAAWPIAAGAWYLAPW